MSAGWWLSAALTWFAADAWTLERTVRGPDGKAVREVRGVLLASAPTGWRPEHRFDATPQRQQAATGDAEGRLSFVDLDPALVYTVLAAAEGCRAERFDAKKGDGPLPPLKLGPDGLTGLPAESLVVGRVLDSDSQPIANAAVHTHAIRRGASTTYGHHGGTPWAMTNAAGEFRLRLEKPTEVPLVQVTARGFAPAKRATNGANGETTIVLGRGAALFGTLLRDGKPVADALLGSAQVNRNSETFLPERHVRTGTDGRFRFENLPAGEPLQLFGVAQSLQAHGMLEPQQVTLAAGAERDVGALALRPGATVAGRLRLRDGDWPDNGLVLGLGGVEAPDQVRCRVGPNGRFAFENVPPGACRLWLVGEALRFAAANRSVDLMGSALIGRADASSDGLRVELEPGRPDYAKMSDWMARNRRDRELARQPLKGTEDR